LHRIRFCGRQKYSLQTAPRRDFLLVPASCACPPCSRLVPAPDVSQKRPASLLRQPYNPHSLRRGRHAVQFNEVYPPDPALGPVPASSAGRIKPYSFGGRDWINSMANLEQIIPVLTYQDIAAAHDFLVMAFGFSGRGVHRNAEGHAV